VKEIENWKEKKFNKLDKVRRWGGGKKKVAHGEEKSPVPSDLKKPERKKKTKEGADKNLEREKVYPYHLTKSAEGGEQSRERRKKRGGKGLVGIAAVCWSVTILRDGERNGALKRTGSDAACAPKREKKKLKPKKRKCV